MHKAIDTIDEKDLIIEQAKALLESLDIAKHSYNGYDRILVEDVLDDIKELESAIKAHDKTYEEQFS